MPEYNCAGCGQKITAGFVAVVEGNNPLYLHFRGNQCIDQYKKSKGLTLITPRILRFSELEQEATD